jgi:WD40 repeat protein
MPPDSQPEATVNWPLLTISPDAQWMLMPINLAEASKSCGAYLWRWQAGATDRPEDHDCIPLAKEALAAAAFSADSTRLGLGYANGAVELLDVAKHTQRLALPSQLGGDLVALAVSPDGEWVAVVDQVVGTSGAPRTLWLWNSQQGTVSKAALKAGDGQSPAPLAFSTDGRWLAVGNQETVQIWDLQTQEGRPAYELPGPPGEVPPLVLSVTFATPKALGPDLRLAVGYSDGAIDLYEETAQPAESVSVHFPTPETPVPTVPIVSNEQRGPELTAIKHLQKSGPDTLTDLSFGNEDGQSLAAASSAQVEIWRGDSLSPMSGALTASPATTIYKIDKFGVTVPDFVRVVWNPGGRQWLVFDTEGGVGRFTLQPPTEQAEEDVLARACIEIETASSDGSGEDTAGMSLAETRNRQIESLKMVCKKYWSRTQQQ